MRVGAFLPSLRGLPLDQALRLLADAGADCVELGTFGGRVAGEYDIDRLLASDGPVRELRGRIRDAGLTISALSCHGNALHPDEAVGRRQRELFRRTVLLAGGLEVDTVVDFAGCPGDPGGGTFPNWVPCAWSEEAQALLRWQWEERLVPYWREAASFLADHGVRVAIEIHPGTCVYQPRELLRLRELAGDRIGANLDPSHLIWQQIDVRRAVLALDDAIYHVHVKDTEMRPHRLGEAGVIDSTPFHDWTERTWIYRTAGFGSPIGFWQGFLCALKEVGYTGALSVEHEDVLIGSREGVLRAVALTRGAMPGDDELHRWWEG